MAAGKASLLKAKLNARKRRDRMDDNCLREGEMQPRDLRNESLGRPNISPR